MLVHVGEHARMLDDSVFLSNRAPAAGCNSTLQVWPQMQHIFQKNALRFPKPARQS